MCVCVVEGREGTHGTENGISHIQIEWSKSQHSLILNFHIGIESCQSIYEYTAFILSQTRYEQRRGADKEQRSEE